MTPKEQRLKRLEDRLLEAVFESNEDGSLCGPDCPSPYGGPTISSLMEEVNQLREELGIVFVP